MFGTISVMLEHDETNGGFEAVKVRVFVSDAGEMTAYEECAESAKNAMRAGYRAYLHKQIVSI